MIPKAVIRGLVSPKLDAHQFSATKWDSAEDKALFGNTLLKFISNDYPRTSFTQKLYKRLSNTFGQIAHYNLATYYANFFEATSAKIAFIDELSSWPCWGDPQHTFCDLERAVIKRVRASGIDRILQTQLSTETRANEIRTLEKLKQKYEPQQTSAPPPGPSPFAPPAKPMTQTSLFDLLQG